MRPGFFVCLLLAAAGCASTPKSLYVPGGEGLPDDVRARYRLAIERDLSGRSAAALRLFDRLANQHPLRLGFHLHRIDLARRVEGVEEAAARYDPPPPGVPPGRAATLARLARLDSTDVAGRRSALEEALSREPGEAFWRLGVADVGITAYELVLARAEREADLGEVQASRRSFDDAKRLLEESRQDAETALQLDADFMEAHLLLGYIAARHSELKVDIDESDQWRKLAGWHYGEALKLDPDCYAAHLNQAEAHLYFDRYSEAAKNLTRAVELAPADPVAWNNLGYTFYGIGRVERAVDCYRRALELRPNYARARTALSDGLRRQGKADQALTELVRARQDAADDRPLLAEIAFKLAAIHEHEGRPREAVREYETHIALGGNDAAKARSRIRRIFEAG